MRARRTAISGLAAAVNCTSAAPWPDDGVRAVIQPELLDAVHAHSGVVDTVTEPVPPVDGTVPEPSVSDSAHFTGDGPVEVSDDDPQALNTPTATQITSARNIDDVMAERGEISNIGATSAVRAGLPETALRNPCAGGVGNSFHE